MSDWYADDINRAIMELAMPATPLSEDESRALRQRVRKIYYAEQTQSPCLWEALSRDWLRVSVEGMPEVAFEYFPTKCRPILFLDEFRSEHAWEFQSVQDVKKVIMDCGAFECYFTSRDCSFLIAWMHEECLVVCV